MEALSEMEVSVGVCLLLVQLLLPYAQMLGGFVNKIGLVENKVMIQRK